MHILHDIKNSLGAFKGSVLAIGNFDGVHKGHQALLKTAKSFANRAKTQAAILTFEPHPRALFKPDEPINRLTPFELKMFRLEAHGIDICFCLHFTREFAGLSADDFIQKVLIDGIGPARIVIGHDFRFGKGRQGTPDMIEKAGIPVTLVDAFKDENDELFSSSRVRQAVQAGNIKLANKILGWDWEIWGEVVKGDQRGRQLGYPTANVDLAETIHPAYGIYAARVQIQGEDKWHKAAVNIGIRPMFEVEHGSVEAYFFDFDRDIYGKTLRIQLVERLRGEEKFDSLEALIAQMDKDCKKAKNILETK